MKKKAITKQLLAIAMMFLFASPLAKSKDVFGMRSRSNMKIGRATAYFAGQPSSGSRKGTSGISSQTWERTTERKTNVCEMNAAMGASPFEF
jgi:hypothetical protein